MPRIDISKALQIPGWMTSQELTWLAQQAQRSRRILEIGCWKGRSTRALYDHMPELSELICIDAWVQTMGQSGDVARHDFAANLPEDDHRVVVYRGESGEILPEFAKLREWFDFIFIDADHSQEAVAQDIAGSLPLLTAGGILAGHDYGAKGCDGVKRAVNAAFRQGVELVGTIWWVKPNL